MRNRVKSCVLGWVAFLIVSSTSLAYSQTRAVKGQSALAAENGEIDFDRVRSYIRRQIVEHYVPSVTVAVAQHGTIIWEEGFGWADRERNIPATPDTMYSLASISKTITATGLMTLVQAHKIDLDHPINDYLGDAKLQGRAGDASGATVRRVANHTSGLPLYYQFFSSAQSYRPPSSDETILRYGSLVTVPGSHYQYSNLGYGILGYVESRISGLSYGDFLRKEVFIPLGMNHTCVGIDPSLEEFQAIRYDGKDAPIPFYVTDHAGASEIYSSAHDLVRFAMFHLKDHLSDQKAILSDASIEEMHRPTTATDEPHDQYGIGWETDNRVDGFRVVYHGGGMPGVTTLLQFVPSEDMAVAVLSNGSSVDRKGIANEIWKILLPAWRVPSQQEEPGVQPFRPSAAIIGKWKGAIHTYQGDVPTIATITSAGEVRVKVGDQLESLFNNPEYKDGKLTGMANAILNTEDATRHHTNVIAFDLVLRGDRLEGSAVAESNGSDYAALAHWIHLQKQ